MANNLKDSKIKIYFDNTIFVLQQVGGISIVFSEIIKRIKCNPNLLITIVINRIGKKNLLFKDLIKGVKIENEFKINNAFVQFAPLLKILPKGSIYHSTYYRFSFQKNTKKVITIHDLGYEKGIMQSGLKRWVHLFFKRLAIKYADAIICVSENTKNDLELYYSNLLNTKCVKVIYNGLSDAFLSSSETKVEKERPYLLYVGGRQKYKNFDKIVDVAQNLYDFDLFICGGSGATEYELKLLKEKLKDRFIIKTNLTTEALIKVYANADCLIYPSSYEGFGLPILEAMACGCPVIACNNSCIPEITGNAALLVEEPTIKAIEQAIRKLQDKDFREMIIKRGKDNAKKFSWDKTVEATTGLYEELINSIIR